MHLLRQLRGMEPTGDLQLITELLPTAYGRAGQRIRELLDQHRPDLCICLGVAQNRRHVCLERLAINLDDCSLPDNDGELALNREIVSGAPLALSSPLPVDELADELAPAEHHPGNCPGVAVSNHAGNYVCNHVYYNALQHIDAGGHPTRCLFIHVPMTADCSGPDENYGWELPTQLQLLEVVSSLIRRLSAVQRAAGSRV